MSRRVVEGGPIRFRDDLPIQVEEIPKPLDLPPAPLPEVFTAWYRGRFFELHRSPGEAWARIWGRTYALQEAESAGRREARYLQEHRDVIAQAQQEWLERVLGGADPEGLLPAIAEKVRELCPLPRRPPEREVGRGKVSRSRERSALAALQGYRRLLFVDGKVYDLLSLAEYLARFEKAMEPALLEELAAACETMTPEQVCQRMREGLDRMDKRTYGVIKGKVHYDRRTFELFLDGVYFIPEYLCREAEFRPLYAASLDRTLKLGAAS